MDLTSALDQIGAVRRGLHDTEKDGKPARALVAEATYPSPAEDVWDALTNAERLPRWFAPVSGDLELGGRFQIEGNASGTVERCEPARALAITWEFGGGLSWVEVDLSESAGETTLVLRHIAHPDPHWEQYGAGAVGIGWDLSLWGLQQHLATGEAMDHEEVEAWGASEAGRDFMTRSGRAWCEAEIAGGTDEAVARERSDRTIGFYTGAEQPG